MIKEISPITLAPLHGTLLAIIIGVFSAYAINIFTRLDNIKYSLFREATKVNNIQIYGSFGLSGSSEYQAYKDNVRNELLKKLTKLSMGVPGSIPPDDYASRGEEILRIISALSHNYPFPQRIKENDSGGFSIGKAKEIKFSNIEEIEKWTEDVAKIGSAVTWIMNTHKEKLKEAMHAFEKNHSMDFSLELPDDSLKALSPGARKDIERLASKSESTMSHMGTNLFEGFLKSLSEMQQIAIAVNGKLDEYMILKKHAPSKAWFFITIGFAFSAFMCAVILPMFIDTMPVVLWKGIPVAFYVYSVILITFKVAHL